MIQSRGFPMQHVRYCSACGHQNTPAARFCVACGHPMQLPTPRPPTAPPPAPAPPVRGTNGLRTATMVIGLLAATFLFIGGCAGSVSAITFGSFEEAFGVEEDRNSEGSTTEEIKEAGTMAMAVSFVLFLGAGLAKVAVKTSLLLLIIAMPMVIGLAMVDSWSLFAFAYYFAILMVGVSIVLMSVTYWRRRRASRQSP